MKIYLNGDQVDVPHETSVTNLLANLRLAGKMLAVELNEQVIARSDYEHCLLAENDKVEIIHAIGGG